MDQMQKAFRIYLPRPSTCTMDFLHNLFKKKKYALGDQVNGLNNKQFNEVKKREASFNEARLIFLLHFINFIKTRELVSSLSEVQDMGKICKSLFISIFLICFSRCLRHGFTRSASRRASMLTKEGHPQLMLDGFWVYSNQSTIMRTQNALPNL